MALVESYTAVEEALARILAQLPAETDVILLSASGMGPNSSRSHLLPAMLGAVLSDGGPRFSKTTGAGGALWRMRAILPTDLRAWVARVLPDHLILELSARLELRGMDWRRTRAFMPPSGDCGYVRLNLRGRERDGIVEPADADALLEEIARGLKTFARPDGEPVIESVERTSAWLGGAAHPLFPDLIVRWNPAPSSPLEPVPRRAMARFPPRGGAAGGTGSTPGRRGRSLCRDAPGWRPRAAGPTSSTSRPRSVPCSASSARVWTASPCWRPPPRDRG